MEYILKYVDMLINKIVVFGTHYGQLVEVPILLKTDESVTVNGVR